MDEFQRVWIVGAGAVGSALAAELTRAGRARIVLVGASAHWAAVRSHGLRVSVDRGEPETFAIQAQPLEGLPALDACDLVLLTGKLPRLEPVLTALRDKTGPDTGVIALQNGLGIAEHVGARLGRPVDRGLLIFGAQSPAPGTVFLFQGGILLGHSPVTEAACRLFTGAAIRCKLIDDIPAAEWRKLAINCLANPLAGLLGVTNARLGQSDLDPGKEAILQEVRTVAAAEGVQLDLRVSDFNAYMAGPTGGNTASLRTDILRGEPTEIDALNGTIVALGQRHGIPTPANALIVSLIKALEAGRNRTTRGS